MALDTLASEFNTAKKLEVIDCTNIRGSFSRVVVNRLDTILVIVIEIKKVHEVNDRAIVGALIALETNLNK